MNKWDHYFMSIVDSVRSLASCKRAKVGAVIVRNNRILSTGYNGSVSGTDSCEDEGCLMVGGHCKRTLHAELNAVLFSPTAPLNGATIYCSHFPCFECAKVLCQVGIGKVIYQEDYRKDQRSIELFEEKFVSCIKYEKEQ